MAKEKAMLSSIWEVVLVEGEDGMMKTMSVDEGEAQAEASNVSCQILHPKNVKQALPTKENS